MKDNQAPQLDVAVVGAGFAGMYLLHRLRQCGFHVRALEAAPEVGGTWYHNRYPGLRCDIESLEYQYAWSEELRKTWRWSERFSAQPEILAYAQWVADQLDLRKDVHFNTRVNSAHWDEEHQYWRLNCSGGLAVTTRHVVFATGALAVPRMPDIPGIENFKGRVIHTAAWPHEAVDFTGQTVGVIGTGSSGLQVSPQIAKQAQQLFVFQRSGAYSIPAQNRKLDETDYDAFLNDLPSLDTRALKHIAGIATEMPTRRIQDVSAQELESSLQERWDQGGAFTFLSAFKDIQSNETSNQRVAEFVRERIREKVKDPVVAEKLCPQYLIATRRTCVDTGYYEMFNQDHVNLIDVAQDAIARFTANGVQLESGKTYALDNLVLATGYDAMTGAFLAVDVRGKAGLSNQDAWSEGPRSLLGLMIAGFPNLYTVTGPGSPSVLTNVIRSIEHHVDWLTQCFQHLREQNIAVMEAQKEAQDAWVQHVNDIAHKTLFIKAPSWYCGSDIPGKPKVFTPYAGGFPAYRAAADGIARDGYRGFTLTPKT